MSQIKCLVEECKYNDAYNCNAGTIEVRSNGATKVNNASQTACETFRTHGSMQG